MMMREEVEISMVNPTLKFKKLSTERGDLLKCMPLGREINRSHQQVGRLP
jgi:hypothetical protein